MDLCAYRYTPALQIIHVTPSSSNRRYLVTYIAYLTAYTLWGATGPRTRPSFLPSDDSAGSALRCCPSRRLSTSLRLVVVCVLFSHRASKPSFLMCPPELERLTRRARETPLRQNPQRAAWSRMRRPFFSASIYVDKEIHPWYTDVGCSYVVHTAPAASLPPFLFLSRPDAGTTETQEQPYGAQGYRAGGRGGGHFQGARRERVREPSLGLLAARCTRRIFFFFFFVGGGLTVCRRCCFLFFHRESWLDEWTPC